MGRIIFSIIVLLSLSVQVLAEDLTDKDSVGDITGEDLLYRLQDPGVTPLDRKDTVTERQTFFFTAPTLYGVFTYNGTPVVDSDCTGQQGDMWYDTGDSTFKFCNANSGAPDSLSASAGDVTAVGPGCSGGACFNDGIITTGTTLLVWEGTSDDGNEFSIEVPENPGADIVITMPASTGTLSVGAHTTANVSTTLEAGTVNATTYGITSDGGADDIVLPEADTTNAGLLGADKWDEIVANSVHTATPNHTTANVSTTLEAGTVNATTYSITSDGGADDITLPEADTDNAGLLGADKWDEIVANTLAKHGVNDANTSSETADAAITKSDEAETLSADWVNTANPWADNEVANDISLTSTSQIADYCPQMTTQFIEAATYTVGGTDACECYGGYLTANTATVITACDNLADNMNFIVVKTVASLVKVKLQSDNSGYLDAATVPQGGYEIEESSAAGKIVGFAYAEASTWSIVSDGWSDGGTN